MRATTVGRPIKSRGKLNRRENEVEIFADFLNGGGCGGLHTTGAGFSARERESGSNKPKPIINALINIPRRYQLSDAGAADIVAHPPFCSFFLSLACPILFTLSSMHVCVCVIKDSCVK